MTPSGSSDSPLRPDQSKLPDVVTRPADPIIAPRPWPEGRWPHGLLNRPAVGGRRGFRERHWAQATVLDALAGQEGRNGIPELARLLCLADAAMSGRYAVIRCRRRLWPIVRRVIG